MSLLNLLLVVWNRLETEYSLDFINKSDLPSQTREELCSKLVGIPHRGFLADWGYAVPFNVLRNDTNPTSTECAISFDASQSPHHPSSPLTSIHSDAVQTSPISVNTPYATSDERVVPIRLLDSNPGSPDDVHYGQKCPHFEFNTVI